MFILSRILSIFNNIAILGDKFYRSKPNEYSYAKKLLGFFIGLISAIGKTKSFSMYVSFSITRVLFWLTTKCYFTRLLSCHYQTSESVSQSSTPDSRLRWLLLLFRRYTFSSGNKNTSNYHWLFWNTNECRFSECTSLVMVPIYKSILGNGWSFAWCPSF